MEPAYIYKSHTLFSSIAKNSRPTPGVPVNPKIILYFGKLSPKAFPTSRNRLILRYSVARLVVFRATHAAALRVSADNARASFRLLDAGRSRAADSDRSVLDRPDAAGVLASAA